MKTALRWLGLGLLVTFAGALSACPRGAASTGPSEPSSPSEPAHAVPDYNLERTTELELGIPVAVDIDRNRLWTITKREVLRYWDLDTGQLLAV